MTEVGVRTPAAGAAARRRHRTWLAVTAGLGIAELITGSWASLAPASFYRRYPGFGLHWVVSDGPFNEHLVRDVGLLNLSLCALTFWVMSMGTRRSAWLLLVATEVYAVPHLLFHVHHRHLLSQPDRVTSLAGLLLFALLPLVAMFASARPSR